jgi:arylsulfatase A-like enzyme
MVIVLFVRKEDHKGIKRVIKNAPINKPNIILVTMDTVRGDHVSCYGYKRTTTPNLDRFSQEGMLYKNAYSTDSWTVPSHASIFTGKYPSKHGAHDHSEIVIKYLNESQKVEKLFAST